MSAKSIIILEPPYWGSPGTFEGAHMSGSPSVILSKYFPPWQKGQDYEAGAASTPLPPGENLEVMHLDTGSLPRAPGSALPSAPPRIASRAVS